MRSCPEQTLTERGGVDREGAPCLDRSSGFGNCVIKPRVARRVGSVECVEPPGEKLCNADDTNQRRVEKPEGMAPVADIAVFKHCRSTQAFDRYRLAKKLRPQRCNIAGAEKCNGIVRQSLTRIGDCLRQ